jgi:hypothetical protein
VSFSTTTILFDTSTPFYCFPAAPTSFSAVFRTSCNYPRQLGFLSKSPCMTFSAGGWSTRAEFRTFFRAFYPSNPLKLNLSSIVRKIPKENRQSYSRIPSFMEYFRHRKCAICAATYYVHRNLKFRTAASMAILYEQLVLPGVLVVRRVVGTRFLYTPSH